MIQIAIDGPAGAGKSSIAKTIAKKFDILYLDTGALYRSIAYFVIKSGFSIEKSLEKIDLKVEYVNFSQQVILNGENITEFIRTPEVSKKASEVSKNANVRKFLLDTQRNIAENNSVIMDGRDIATVILPEADVKIFLTASAEKRAKRRYLELLEAVPYEEILAEIVARDTQDANREIAPLKPAEDSVILDTSNLNLDESIEKAMDIIVEKLENNK
ncbi:MAG: (d)CMP kinase [Clostridia bacterium]